jgi:hypothetical protein
MYTIAKIAEFVTELRTFMGKACKENKKIIYRVENKPQKLVFPQLKV